MSEPRRAGRLERALTGVVAIALATGVAWGLARPSALISPPVSGEAPRERRAPECRRVRFDLKQLLGERWRPLAASCLRGDCKGLREELVARNFPLAEWRLVDPDAGDEGCAISSRAPSTRDAACTRLQGRVEGSAPTLLLQAEGECRE